MIAASVSVRVPVCVFLCVCVCVREREREREREVYLNVRLDVQVISVKDEGSVGKILTIPVLCYE